AAASQPAEELLDPHELTSVPRQSLQRWLAKSLRGQVRCGPPSLSNLAQYPLPYRAIAAHLAATDGKAEWQTDAHNAIVPLGDLCIGLVCDICLACVSTFARPCCAKIYCARCLTAYALETMRQAQTTVGCPNLLCDKIMPQAEVMCRLPSDERWRYQRFLDNSRANGPLRKTCPGCACPTELSAKAWRRPLQVECSSCGLVWCFPCHAPMHRGVTCRQFRASDQELLAWSKRCDAAQGAQRNARQCPGCGAYIQKSQGCDSMTCSQCGTRFCYLCGQRYARCPLLGSHKSRMSVMGCRYNLLPDRPHLRRFVRGCVLAVQLIAAPALLVLASAPPWSAPACLPPTPLSPLCVGDGFVGLFDGRRNCRAMLSAYARPQLPQPLMPIPYRQQLPNDASPSSPATRQQQQLTAPRRQQQWLSTIVASPP
ncbi:hypothetical protein BOX15_Mlig021995g2, partial [Macrostomum lignano]